MWIYFEVSNVQCYDGLAYERWVVVGSKKRQYTNFKLWEKTINLKQIHYESHAICDIVYKYQKLNKDRNTCYFSACLWPHILSYYKIAIDLALGLSICNIYSSSQRVIGMKVSIICSCLYFLIFHLLSSCAFTFIFVILIWAPMTRLLY